MNAEAAFSAVILEVKLFAIEWFFLFDGETVRNAQLWAGNQSCYSCFFGWVSQEACGVCPRRQTLLLCPSEQGTWISQIMKICVTVVYQNVN